MKTIFVTTEEWYPVLVPREHDGSCWANLFTKYEVPDELLERWKKLDAEFTAFQTELSIIAPKS